MLPTFGLLTNATALNNIQTNQVAGLADFYVTSRVAGALGTFMQNSGIYASQGISNGGFSDYNSLQLELRRQYRSGFFGQINYTMAQSNTNSAGTAQNRFEAFMDNLRPELNTGRSVFHVTHVINAQAIYELPFGQGKPFLNRGGLTNVIFGDWQLATIVTWQGGSPLSIYSGRGTFNRAGRSNCADPIGCNTAFSTMSADEIKKLMGIYKTANGNIYWIDPKVIDLNTGRAVGADNATNSAGFAGPGVLQPGRGRSGQPRGPDVRRPAPVARRPRGVEAVPPLRSLSPRVQGRGVQPVQRCRASSAATWTSTAPRSAASPRSTSSRASSSSRSASSSKPVRDGTPSRASRPLAVTKIPCRAAVANQLGSDPNSGQIRLHCSFCA